MKKIEPYHGILPINGVIILSIKSLLPVRIILCTKFKLKLTILSFWTKSAQKSFFRSKTEDLNITIEFYIFELHKFQISA